MNPQFEQILKRYEELMAELANPDVYGNQSLYVSVVKEQSELEPIVTQIRLVAELQDELDELQMMYDESDHSDAEMRQLLREERQAVELKYEKADEKLKLLLIPGDPNDDRNVLWRSAVERWQEAALCSGVISRNHMLTYVVIKLKSSIFLKQS